MRSRRPNANTAAPSGPHALELRSICAGYGEKQILWDISFTLAKGSTLAILGPNGAGKTTLLKVASGVLKATAGSVYIDGVDVTRRPSHARVKHGLCHIPDPRGIFPSLTVRENLILQAPGGRSTAAIDRAVAAFPRLGQRLTQTAGTMSGGEQQMLAVARSYIQRPDVVLLDEVSMGLAPNLVDEIFQFLQTLSRDGVSLVIVEQFVHRALSLADRVAVMARGQILLSGEADAFTEDQIFDAYTGVRHEGAVAHA